MNIKVNYGDSVLVIPGAAVGKIKDAQPEYLTVLLALLADDSARTGEKEVLISALSERAGCERDTVLLALEFWRGAGVISLSAEKAKSRSHKAENAAEKATAQETEPKLASKESTSKKKERAAELPNYTTSELVELLAKRKDAAMLIDECQRTFGKMFNTMETNIVLGLVDYLDLDGEYVLTLLSRYAKRSGEERKSLRYIEKVALSLYDSGITTTEALCEYFKFLDKKSELEGKIRTLFGIGSRAFSTKEKKCIEQWVQNLDYDLDVIQHAYDITVNSIHQPSIPYAHSILENWKSAGHKTLADIEAAEDERRAQKAAESGDAAGSFDTNDFFEAALRRSYGDSTLSKK